MNVPWNSIKQRHHFIAENLMQYYKVDVFLRYEFKYKNLTSSYLHYLYRIPLQRYEPILYLNQWLIKKQISKQVKKYDIIWLTTPQQYSFIESSLSSQQKLIYDCMDDMLCFPEVIKSKRLYNTIFNNEKKILERADFVFTSAESLKSILQRRYNTKRKIYVENNAIEKNQACYCKRSNNFNHTNSIKRITYIGAIAPWIDFELLEQSIKIHNDIEYHFYGPLLPGVKIPNADKFYFHGAIKHNKIYTVMEDANLLIMPFKKNKLIMSVNPIKLYEYIKSSTPAISVKYPETEKFSKFVYLYDTSSDFMHYIDLMCSEQLEKLGTENEINHFLSNNTWESRVKDIFSIVGP